jgi:hypothetical protein
MEQFFSFGFTEAEISYLPLSYIFSIRNAGMDSNFVTSPFGSIFKLDSNKKRLFFEYQTYIAQNPSDSITALSYYLADKIPSGNPITDKAVLVQQPDGNTVHLYINNTYYGIQTYDTLSCWGLNTSALNTPTYRLRQSNYTQAITPTTNLSCVTSNDGSNQLLNQSQRLSIPSSISVTPQVLNQDLRTLAARLPLRQNNVSPYVKSASSDTVWSIENGKKRVIPTFTTFTIMGLSTPNIDVVDSNFVNMIPEDGIKLAEGQLVKSPNSDSVYVITGSQRVLYHSGTIFEAYKNSWSSIETFSQSDLDRNYTYNNAKVSNIVVDKSTNKAYVVNTSVCYALTPETLSAMGKNIATLSTAQPFEISAFRFMNFNACTKSSTMFIKEDGTSLVYWVNNGQKHPLTTYNAMLNKNNGTSPSVMTIDPAFIQSIPSGQVYTQ